MSRDEAKITATVSTETEGKNRDDRIVSTETENSPPTILVIVGRGVFISKVFVFTSLKTRELV